MDEELLPVSEKTEISFDTDTATASEEDKPSINKFALTWRRQQQDEAYELKSPIGIEITQALMKAVAYEDSFHYQVLSAFCCMPSILCDIAPIVYILGGSGSGKSQAAKVVGAIVGQKLIVGSSTAASLKRKVNQIRWQDPSTLTYEKNCHLVMDNVNQELFLQDQALGTFLNGYDRETDEILISGEKDGLVVFKTFCPKLIDSYKKNG
jgi:hypothetical protein